MAMRPPSCCVISAKMPLSCGAKKLVLPLAVDHLLLRNSA